MSTTLRSPLSNTLHTAAPEQSGKLTVALVGNPNAGKTSLFNALTGLRQKVANYPGVTVERKEGTWNFPVDVAAQASAHSSALPAAIRLIDLPGLYSLDAASLDERIALNVILGEMVSTPAPDVLIAVVDATNLERNLYLITQLLELDTPLVVALTMIDRLERSGMGIDEDQLSARLGVPVVPVVAARRRGLAELASAVARAATTHTLRSNRNYTAQRPRLSVQAEAEIKSLIDAEANEASIGAERAARFKALRDLYGAEIPPDGERHSRIAKARERLKAGNPNWWQEPVLARYRWIEDVTVSLLSPHANGNGRLSALDRTDGQTVGTRRDEKRTSLTITERIDAWATHKFFGPALFFGLMLLVFQSIFSWATLPMDLIDGLFGSVGEAISSALPEGLLSSLIVDGIIAGVGGVLIFLPQIVLLFLFITLLEDSGYMARAAFLMDRLMRGVGLHGKAFVPLLSSFACAIPGIMATRTIENPKDRLATIMIAPLMSCSARLPVYTLMIAAFFTNSTLGGFIATGAVVLLSMYLLGIFAAIAVAWILKRTLLRAPAPPLVMEMPPYRLPHLGTVLHTVANRAWIFIRRAGTVILALSIILWALMTFPRSTPVTVIPDHEHETVTQDPGQTNPEVRNEVIAEANEKGVSAELAGDSLRHSFAGRIGRFIEPVIEPLGFDWRIGIGLVASFAAREVLVSTLSIVYNVAEDETANSASLVEAIRTAKRPNGTPVWTPLVAVSLMVFFVLACQCLSTVAIVRRETNSWAWTGFMVAYMLVLAYAASFITYQGGRLLGFA